MELLGRVQNGVVVFDESHSFPEGTVVVVTCRQPQHASLGKKRVQFPLVPSASPGSVHLTNAKINELLDEEDASS